MSSYRSTYTDKKEKPKMINYPFGFYSLKLRDFCSHYTTRAHISHALATGGNLLYNERSREKTKQNERREIDSIWSQFCDDDQVLHKRI